MGYEYERTHESLLGSARAHILESGFRDASIRRICADAGVTNGAFYAHFKSKEDLFCELVEPTLKGLYSLYSSESDAYMTPDSADDVLALFERTFSSDQALIRYVFAHKDAFRLLLEASGGTAYEGFPDTLVDEERRATVAFFEQCKPYVEKPENLTESIAMCASSLVVSTVFECLLAGRTEEEATREVKLASEFCLAGIRRIAGI